MKDSGDNDPAPGAAAATPVGLYGHRPALQVVCLGSGGGPSEDNVTGLLVRSIASDWARGSLLAVDAGSHLAPITRILERDFPSVSGEVGREGENGHTTPGLSRPFARASLSPPGMGSDEETPKPEPMVLESGPFAGLKFPNASARANALHIIRNFVSTYLITHPHLDHLSGFAINTAAFHATSRPKTLAALPSTVDAVKTHIFNDIIWPNLTDEDGGVGFVTFQRLKEGGDVMVGEGEGRGYIDVSDGLGVKAFKVSHGVCTKSPPSHHHRGSIAGIADQPPYNGSAHGEPAPGMSRQVSMSQHSQYSTPGTPGITPRPSFYGTQQQPSPRMNATDPAGHTAQPSCVVDSTAFFIRDEETNREVLIFGDVEPDSISLSPRNFIVWQEAARKIAHGVLGGIFIECSYDDSQADAVLFGHLNPKHLIAELQNLASMVVDAKAMRLQEKGVKKRKRSGPNGLDVVARSFGGGESEQKRSRSLAGRNARQEARRGSVPDRAMPDLHQVAAQSGSIGGAHPASSSIAPSMSAGTLQAIQHEHAEHLLHHQSSEPLSPKAIKHPHPFASHVSSTNDAAAASASAGMGMGMGRSTGGVAEPPLHGIKVVVIHVKDTLKDGPHVRETILAQLRDYEERLKAGGGEDEAGSGGGGLGCEFLVAESGGCYWF